MSTRGAVGIRKNNQDKLMYNHFDSYPSGLGEQVVSYIRTYTDTYISYFFNNLKEITEENDNIKIIDTELKEQENYGRIIRQYFQDDEEKDNLTLENVANIMEGNLEFYGLYPEIKYYIQSNNFIKDSLFCEWAYIINLDNKKLEIYKGRQKKSQKNNRYGSKEDNGYYPCKLIKQIPLSTIRKDNFNLKEKLNYYI